MMKLSTKSKLSNFRPFKTSLCVAGAWFLCMPAVQAYDPTTTLGSVDGLTEQQQRTGDAIQSVCGQFLATGAANGEFDTTREDVAQQQALFDACGEMVHTANSLAGNDGPTAKDLGINEQQLAAALQNVAAEEVAAAGSLATESVAGQSNIVGRRLAGILSRASTLQVSSANIQGSNSIILASLPEEFALAESGGAAAADDPGLSSPLGFYINALGASARKTGTEREDGFSSDTGGISLGIDYLFTNSFLAGINLGFSSSVTDFTITDNVSGGSMDATQTNVSAYGMWFNDVGYIDVVAGFGAGSYDMDRRIIVPSADDAAEGNDGANATVTGNTDSTAGRISLGGGMEIRSGALSFAPYGRVSYLGVAMDGYEEEGESALKLRVESQDIDSLTTGFGFRLVGTYSGTKAIVSPQFNVEMIHEFLDDSRQIVSTYVHDPRNIPLVIVTDNPDRTYYTMGIGASAVFTNGLQLFGEVRSLMDLDDLNEFSTTAGLRFAF